MHTKTSAQSVDAVVPLAVRTAGGIRLRAALAASIAKNARYDLHALIELVERGCRPELAVRILAPLEEESAA